MLDDSGVGTNVNRSAKIAIRSNRRPAVNDNRTFGGIRYKIFSQFDFRSDKQSVFDFFIFAQSQAIALIFCKAGKMIAYQIVRTLENGQLEWAVWQFQFDNSVLNCLRKRAFFE